MHEFFSFNFPLHEYFFVRHLPPPMSFLMVRPLAGSCPHRNRYLLKNFMIKYHNLPNYKQQPHDLYDEIKACCFYILSQPYFCFFASYCNLMVNLLLILPDECGHLLATQNRAVVIKRCTISEVLNQFIIIIHSFIIDSTYCLSKICLPLLRQ